MKNTIAIVLLFLLSIGISAQTIDLNQALPVDQNIKKGVLKNGLTYYISKTDVVKNVASYYIIQNVGSVLENDDQQGLAHFLEHMAFNGTENFEGKEILNTLQKEGIVFGKNINAYTSFDETVYNIDNVPTAPKLIDTGLLILRDWCHYLLLTDEEIDAERGVIKEEWRTRQTGGLRIFQKSLPTLFNGSKYAQRMPIGQMDIVENFKYKALRDFYHDWYRTDLQAIAIIGDINVDEIEQKIIDLFSTIPPVEDPKERFIVEIPDNEAPQYVLVMDDEVSIAQISFGIRHPRNLKDETVADLKGSLLNQMITTMLSARINEQKQDPQAPFLRIRVGYSDHSRATNAFSVQISPKPNQQQEAFKVALNEINRLVKFGFTTSEIDRTIVQFKNYYENQISKREDISHGQIANTIQQNYLENKTMTDIEKEYELVKQIFNSLTKEEVHRGMKNLYTQKNRYIITTGVNENNNLTQTAALEIIKTAEDDKTLVPYSDEFSGKTLISGIEINNGKIVSEVDNDVVGSKTFILSNGIKVHYKFTDKNKNDVKLNAISEGGMSLVEDSDLPSANLMGNVVQLSGLGDYSPTDLTKVLAGKTASAGISLSSINEAIVGSSVTKDVETMLQMVHLRFVKPRFDMDAYKVLMGNVDNYLIKRSNDINEKIKDSVIMAIYGNNNPKTQIFNSDYVEKISFEKIKETYLERFGNASDFEFFIVGDLQPETLKPLLEKYIASIPTDDTKERWKDNTAKWQSNAIDKDIYLKMEHPKSSVRIGYKNEIEYSLKNELIARALGDILQLRFTETLREQEGGTYGASAGANVSKRPVESASVSVSFDCNPEKVEKLVVIVHREIENMAKGKIQQTDLNKVTTNYLKERKEQQQYNSYEMSLLINYFREGYHMNDPKNFEDLVNNISVADIQGFTKRLLKNADSYEITIQPK
ncbi:M16 family metallopeptidase [Lutibacter sp.]|uniref:M16 family metallopeptidase n=1 Tax=Lutibacter sp. TaxID=1925666 RepID=UPI003563B272